MRAGLPIALDSGPLLNRTCTERRASPLPLSQGRGEHILCFLIIYSIFLLPLSLGRGAWGEALPLRETTFYRWFYTLCRNYFVFVPVFPSLVCFFRHSQ